jgi:hypothetical protein
VISGRKKACGSCLIEPWGRDGRMKQATGIRKRKAETQDNERLSKRMSLLNLGMCITLMYHRPVHETKR